MNRKKAKEKYGTKTKRKKQQKVRRVTIRTSL